jgi:hypothetical protein
MCLVQVADYRMIPHFSRNGDLDRAPRMRHITAMPEIALCPA